jgi:hypothetical protein
MIGRIVRLAALITALAVPAAPQQRLLVLDFEILDTSGEPIDHRADHARRLGLIRDSIAQQLADSKTYTIADREAVRGELDAILARQFLRSCNGCELDLARRAGADLVMLGGFHKVSTLIGRMEIAIKDANTGEIVYARMFGFRGDTDEAWLRAARFFIDELRRSEGARRSNEVEGGRDAIDVGGRLPAIGGLKAPYQTGSMAFNKS